MDIKAFQDYRVPDETVLWINFTSFETMVESLLWGGLLLESQVIKLFRIILKGENISALDQAFLHWNNLEYIVEEIREALGDRMLKDITRNRMRQHIREFQEA